MLWGHGGSLAACIRNGLESILDTIAPPKDRGIRTKSRHLADIPISPTAHELLGAHITAIMEYEREAVQDLIRTLKYDGSRHAAHLAAAALVDYLHEEIATIRQFSTREILLVPVPLHRARERERGFNQIELVMRVLPKEFRDGTLARLAPEVIERVRATKAQTRLPRAERLTNVANAFSVRDPARLRHTHAFLIDDVTTTGATLKSAGAALEKAGAKVTLLALARA